MVQAALLERVRQRPHDVILPHHLLEAARAVFACKDDVTHEIDSS